jgi:hypothetical protein
MLLLPRVVLSNSSIASPDQGRTPAAVCNFTSWKSLILIVEGMNAVPWALNAAVILQNFGTFR